MQLKNALNYKTVIPCLIFACLSATPLRAIEDGWEYPYTKEEEINNEILEKEAETVRNFFKK